MNLRKKLIIFTTAILIVCYIAGITAAAIVYNQPPVAPMPSVIRITAEPDYLVYIGWDKVPNAYAYELICKYENEPTVTHNLSTAKNYAKIERVKGNLTFKIRTLYRNGTASEYCEPQTYFVPSLYLFAAKQGNLVQYESGIKFAAKGWETVNYVFKGKPNYVNYYDCIPIGPGMDKDVELEYKLNMRTIPAVNIATNYFFEFGSGQWEIYYRPSYCYAVSMGNKLYNEEMAKVYDETDEWTMSSITVK